MRVVLHKMPKRLSAAAVRARRHDMGLTAQRFARLTGASDGRVVRKWEASDHAVPMYVSILLWVLDQLPADAHDKIVNKLTEED